MPACMNRLGDMTKLVSLKLSQNKLRSLPSRCVGVMRMDLTNSCIDNDL